MGAWIVRVAEALAVVLVGTQLLGCSAGAAGQGSGSQPSVSIHSVAPYYGPNSNLNLGYAVAGQDSFQLLVDGAGFTPSSVVQWNGSPLPTQFGENTDIAANVPGDLIAAPGNAMITVQNPGVTSNAVQLEIASSALLTAGVTQLITAAPDGTPANGDSLVSPSISATGRYVAFQSNATNLAPGPASGYQEIYERDTCIGAPAGCTPSTIRITATYDGSAANGHSRDSAISADGRYVAFDSSATNILPNSMDCSPSTGLACVFIRDTCTGAMTACTPQTMAVSVDSGGAIVRGGGVAVSQDGRYVVFGSPAPNVAPGETAGIGDEFVRDTCNLAPAGCVPSTTLLSVSSSGAARDGYSGPSAASSAGRYIAFQSWASNIVPSETVVPGEFWRDTCIGAAVGCTQTTVRIDVNSSGAQADKAAANGSLPAISGDGRFVAFGSGATNLVSPSFCTESSGCGNVYVRDTCTGAPAGCAPSTKIASLANDGSIGNCHEGGSPGNQTNVSMSADGRFVSFGSISTNLTPDDTFPVCAGEDIFVRDTCTGVVSGCVPSLVRASVANTPQPGTSSNAINSNNAMSADGHYVVFISSATNFLPGVAANGHAMVYLAQTGF